jgi:hypothetical protein
MAEPFTQVPQGQVGTGTAYVHQYRDNSAAIQAMAEAARQKRIDEQKKLASLKDFNYAEVTDQTMADEIRQEYKEGLDFFAQIFVNGGDPTNLTTEEGRMFSEFKQQIQDKAKQANSATARYNKYSDAVLNNPNVYDIDIWNALQDNYAKAKTTDEKIAVVTALDPIAAKNFDFTKWVDNAVGDVAKDVLIVDQTADMTQYEKEFGTKLEGIPVELAFTPEYDIAQVKWQKKKDAGDPNFQQPDFATFLQERVTAEGDRRLSDYQSARSKLQISTSVNLAGQTSPGGGTFKSQNTAAKNAAVALYNNENTPSQNTYDASRNGLIKIGNAPSTDTKVLQADSGEDLGVFIIEGNDVYVDPVQYAKNYHYNNANEYTVGQDPRTKGKTLSVNFRQYGKSGATQTAELTSVFYDQGGNMWGQSEDKGYFLLAPRDMISPLANDVSWKLNAQAVLTTFFGEDVSTKSPKEILDLMRGKYLMFDK